MSFWSKIMNYQKTVMKFEKKLKIVKKKEFDRQSVYN